MHNRQPDNIITDKFQCLLFFSIILSLLSWNHFLGPGIKYSPHYHGVIFYYWNEIGKIKICYLFKYTDRLDKNAKLKTIYLATLKSVRNGSVLKTMTQISPFIRKRPKNNPIIIGGERDETLKDSLCLTFSGTPCMYVCMWFLTPFYYLSLCEPMLD